MTLEATLDATVGTDAVAFGFVVTNAGPAVVELSFPSGLVADVAAFNADDEAVWRWSDGRVFTQVVRSMTLAPGESFVREATWTAPPPGAYEAVAVLRARNHDVEARTTVTV